MSAYNFSCKGCTDRTPGCHGHCERYQKEKAEWDAIKEKQNRANAIRCGLNEQTFKAIGKMQRAHGGKRIDSRG